MVLASQNALARLGHEVLPIDVGADSLLWLGAMNNGREPFILSVYLVAALALGGVDSFVGLIVGATLIYVLENRAVELVGNTCEGPAA